MWKQYITHVDYMSVQNIKKNACRVLVIKTCVRLLAHQCQNILHDDGISFIHCAVEKWGFHPRFLAVSVLKHIGAVIYCVCVYCCIMQAQNTKALWHRVSNLTYLLDFQPISTHYRKSMAYTQILYYIDAIYLSINIAPIHQNQNALLDL